MLFYLEVFAREMCFCLVRTTGEAGGLHWPYKGLIQPCLKTHE